MSHFHSYSPFPGPLLTSVIGDHSFRFILPVFLSTKDPEHLDTHTCMNVQYICVCIFIFLFPLISYTNIAQHITILHPFSLSSVSCRTICVYRTLSFFLYGCQALHCVLGPQYQFIHLTGFHSWTFLFLILCYYKIILQLMALYKYVLCWWRQMCFRGFPRSWVKR